MVETELFLASTGQAHSSGKTVKLEIVQQLAPGLETLSKRLVADPKSLFDSIAASL